jgi:DNA-binding CsgD family transcriptional regulator
MHQHVATWLSTMRAVTSLVAFKSVIDSIVHQIGFRYFVYRGHFPGFPAEDNEIRIDTAPPAWHDYCRQARVDTRWDPLHLRSLRTVMPILWRDVRPMHQAHFDKARELGLATGVTQPMHGPRGEWSSISFIKDRAGLRAERDVLDALPQCQLVTSFAHHAVQRILKQRLDASLVVPIDRPEPASNLSERESECLALAALGKTLQQISAIIPISERTVAFHLANARRKLGAGSLRHAVSKAASLGIIRAA